MASLLQQLTLSGAKQTVVTDLDEARWEHVLEEATDELFGGDGATLELVSGRFFVGKSDVAILQLAETVVTEGDAKDVRGQILESLLARADGFGMDHPGFLPDAGWYLSKEFGLLEGLAELSAEDRRKRFDGNEKVFARGTPAAVVSETAAADDVMNVRMIEQLSGPGVEHADHTQTTTNKPWVLS